MSEPSHDQGLFIVDLRSLDLPPDVAQRIGHAVRRAALTELASVDTPLSVALTFRNRSDEGVPDPTERWPMGLWIEPTQPVEP